MTGLETSILQEFSKCFPEYLKSPADFKSIEDCERSFSVKGFLTELSTLPKLQTLIQIDRLILNKVTATLNANILAGFLVYLENDHLSALEGYTFEEKWPETIERFIVNNGSMHA